MDRRNTRWSERCFECRRKLAPGPWTFRPIPRLGGAERDVCFPCAETIDAQTTLLDVDREAQIAATVDRAVAVGQRARENPSRFLAPADVADLAEDEGHPLALPLGARLA